MLEPRNTGRKIGSVLRTSNTPSRPHLAKSNASPGVGTSSAGNDSEEDYGTDVGGVGGRIAMAYDHPDDKRERTNILVGAYVVDTGSVGKMAQDFIAKVCDGDYIVT